MLNRFLKGKQDARAPPETKRPYLASEAHTLQEAEKWRFHVIKDISKEVSMIQDGMCMVCLCVCVFLFLVCISFSLSSLSLSLSLSRSAYREIYTLLFCPRVLLRPDLHKIRIRVCNI